MRKAVSKIVDSRTIAFIVLIVMFGCQSEPGSEPVAAATSAQPTCLDGYGPLDLDIVNSLSWTHSSQIENLSSCADQHDILRQLADIPKDQRDDGSMVSFRIQSR
jgi:hypothetical protein